MSVPSSNPLSQPGRPATVPLAFWVRRAQEGALNHAILLDRCFREEGRHWSDALVARTRRHVGGAVAAVETALQLELAKRSSPNAAIISSLSAGCAWKALRRRPEVLTVSLLGYFQDRAAIGLMQQFGPAGDVASPECKDSPLSEEGAEMLAAIRLATLGWADTGPDDVAIRADLTAEAMAELVWTVAALLADQAMGTGAITESEVLSALHNAGRAFLVRHDEQNGPEAMAALLAHRLRSLPPAQVPLVALARERQVLALVAIAAERTGLAVGMGMRLVAQAPEEVLFAFFHAAGFPREAAVRLVLGRRCVCSGADDATLIGYADEYERIAPEDARATLAAWAVAPLLRERLAILRDGRAVGHDG